MSTPHPSRRAARPLTLPLVAALSLSALTACSHDSSTAAASPTSSPAATTASATPSAVATSPAPAATTLAAPATSAAAPESEVPLTQPTDAAGASTGAAGTDTATTAPTASFSDAEAVWRTAGEAIINDDQDTFLRVSSRPVLDELTAEQTGAGGLTWKDWNVMGGHSEQPTTGVTQTAGACVEGTSLGVEPPQGTSVTCEIDAVQEGGEPMAMGYFFLGQGSDGSYRVLGYQRNYQ